MLVRCPHYLLKPNCRPRPQLFPSNGCLKTTLPHRPYATISLTFSSTFSPVPLKISTLGVDAGSDSDDAFVNVGLRELEITADREYVVRINVQCGVWN
jgi:hypothetical protein